jgi:hypothetical protein
LRRTAGDCACVVVLELVNAERDFKRKVEIDKCFLSGDAIYTRNDPKTRVTILQNFGVDLCDRDNALLHNRAHGKWRNVNVEFEIDVKFAFRRKICAGIRVVRRRDIKF